MSRDRFPLHRLGSRRRFLKGMTASLAGLSMSRWLPALAAAEQQPRRSCVLLWMTGGPSTIDTFDLKPGHANGGPFREIATASPELRISEHLPRLAQLGDRLCAVRGLSTREGDHGRGTYLMHTGRSPEGVVRYPTLGSLVSKAIGQDDIDFPNFVSVNPSVDSEPTAFESGFLGPSYASLVVKSRDPQLVVSNYTELGVDNLVAPPSVSPRSVSARLTLLDSLQDRMLSGRTIGPSLAHNSTLERALRLMSSDAGKVFDLSTEPAEVRDRYGAGSFGQGCLLARRLVEQGVPFIEVNLGEFGRWDTHNDNFTTVQQLSAELDAGWASLMEDLDDRGLLDTTTILWMGEFGRTPQINGGAGRDHFPDAWSAVLAGGGIRGGQAHGSTSDDGQMVVDGETGTGDLLATFCAAAGIDPSRQNISDIGRPFKIAEGQPIADILS